MRQRLLWLAKGRELLRLADRPLFHLHRIREDQAMSAADNRELDEIVRGSEIELRASRIIAACRQSK
jgi:hypothetical protein